MIRVARKRPQKILTVVVISVDVVVMMVVVSIVVQGDAVELLKGINQLTAGCRKTRVQWHPLEMHLASAGKVHALALLDVAEVDRIDPLTLVRDNRRLHMSDESPLGSPEERMRLDVGRARLGAQASVLIFDQELPDQGLAEAGSLSVFASTIICFGENTYLDIC